MCFSWYNILWNDWFLYVKMLSHNVRVILRMMLAKKKEANSSWWCQPEEKRRCCRVSWTDGSLARPGRACCPMRQHEEAFPGRHQHQGASQEDVLWSVQSKPAPLKQLTNAAVAHQGARCGEGEFICLTCNWELFYCALIWVQQLL